MGCLQQQRKRQTAMILTDSIRQLPPENLVRSLTVEGPNPLFAVPTSNPCPLSLMVSSILLSPLKGWLNAGYEPSFEKLKSSKGSNEYFNAQRANSFITS
jgi:hypothetical protein